MTVFNAFLKVIKKNWVTIVIYTAITVFFAGMNVQTEGSGGQFVSEKPDILIINHDRSSEISKNFEKYLTDNSYAADINTDDETIADALFYREICCVVTIPKNFGSDTLAGKSPVPEIQSTGESYSAFAEMMITRYIRIQNAYAQSVTDEGKLISLINDAVNTKGEVIMKSKIDTTALSKASSYFNFAAYSIMSCILFIICLVLSSFNAVPIRKRTSVSSMNYKKFNFDLFMSSMTYAMLVWLFFAVLGYFMVGNVILSLRGVIYILNLFVFSITTLSLAYFLSTFLTAKNAITGIVNVITLGFSFLCGVFVPTEYLPSWVLHIAHILPTYWYVDSNNQLAAAEHLSTNIMPVITNMLVLSGFTVVFVSAGIMISGKKRKIA